VLGTVVVGSQTTHEDGNRADVVQESTALIGFV